MNQTQTGLKDADFKSFVETANEVFSNFLTACRMMGTRMPRNLSPNPYSPGAVLKKRREWLAISGVCAVIKWPHGFSCWGVTSPVC